MWVFTHITGPKIVYASINASPIMLVSHCGEYMANGLTNAVRHEFVMIANDRQTFVDVRKHTNIWRSLCDHCELMANCIRKPIRHTFATIWRICREYIFLHSQGYSPQCETSISVTSHSSEFFFLPRELVRTISFARPPFTFWVMCRKNNSYVLR